MDALATRSIGVRWVTFRGEGGDRVGIVVGDLVHELPETTSLLQLLGDDGERLHRAGERALGAPARVVSLDKVVLRPPIPQPPSLRDFYAFEQHARTGRPKGLPEEWYEMPVFYFGNPASLIGPYDPVPMPPGSEMLDFEVEVAAVVGLPCANASPAAAARSIVGFALMNDWSARDLQRREMRVGLGPAKGKDFATSLGPWLVTRDELEDRRAGCAYDLALTAHVNGRPYTSANLSDIYWSFEEMLSFASLGTVVHAGDVIGSGTCGTGCIFELSRTNNAEAYPWLAIGDVVELSAETLGAMRNEVRAGPPLHELRPVR